MRVLSVLVAASMLTLTAHARELRLVAVLPLDVRHAPSLDAASREMLLESIRTVAGDHLGREGFTVLTGENTIQILEENGIDPDRACEASCALEMARELRASLFISGSVAAVEGSLVAFVRLFENRQGRQLASVQLEGKGVLELRRIFAEKAEGFFARALPEPGPQVVEDRPRMDPPPTPRPSLATLQHGLYRSAPSFDGTVRWLRFFPEGRVMTAVMRSDATAQEVVRALRRGGSAASGTFWVNGRRLTFYTRQGGGLDYTDYEASIEPDALRVLQVKGQRQEIPFTFAGLVNE